ncbi:sigma-B regulation protein RsbU (phosphoserine phosphatase) [Melghirimyces profundicolus]|uniref:Sigma-B regulation protein RsbU (Phosphoserine phosphatase) n=1 Tax=Melghirimyces profundicolus TaxID=1242148 RepID=A0A2T6BS12_9BACL|nr:PP2C family protein-serine/threonine phosphatase [Melghirimyces profundicolus]PTX58883.1 sigma-B regulation protein RsbU (phosphoserine phosphatase) [Melghirimyces profundicolus]
MKEKMIEQYQELLTSYLKDKQEDQLYAAQQMSKWMLEQKIPPEEMVTIHAEAVKRQMPDLPENVRLSFNLLIEMMIGYGIALREHENLLNRQRELEYEIEVAVGMQQTLLPDSPPAVKDLEVGVISVPANRMSGDYYNFVNHGGGSLGVALSDIIGKGIPAALCMSMIKYAMDQMDHPLGPSETLRRLNTVVERNVDPSMFITMVYGVYDSEEHIFRYAAAGHEPGIFHRAKAQTFEDMTTRGLVLGVAKDISYEEYSLTLAPGDAIILFSDGVTEARIDGQFLGRERFKELVKPHLQLPAQQAVEAIYQDLFEKANYDLKDDQTILLIRRKS